MAAKGMFATLDRFLGRGSASVTVPPMDGALKPNHRIDKAESLLRVAAPDNLAASGEDILFSSGRRLMRAAGGDWTAVQPVAEYSSDIQALAVGPSGEHAVALSSGIEIRDGSSSSTRTIGQAPSQADAKALSNVVALTFADAGTVIACLGSAKNAVEDWPRDLIEKEAAGSVWSIDVRTGAARVLGDALSFPYGAMPLDGGELLVSESWMSRLVVLGKDRGKMRRTVLGDIPGYPARLVPRSGGGAWLCVFAPRSQLMEFVIREKAYRRRMMAEVDPEFWIAPSLKSGVSFSEPMQGGALKQMGVLKPWAPTRSYGLVVGLDRDFAPDISFHSRAGGVRHGVTSCLEWQGRLIMTAKGGDEIISLDPKAAES